MATVRISAELKNEILSNVNKLFEARISAAHAAVMAFKQKVTEYWRQNNVNQKVYEFWNENPELKNYFHSASSIGIRAVYTLEGSENRRGFPFPNCEIEGGNHCPVSYKVHGYGDPEETKVPATEIPGLFEALTAWHKVRQEQAALHEEVARLLDSAGSLQQVHKVFPSILDFCPQGTVAKFNQKVEKVKAAEVVLDESLLLGLTKARMLSNVASN
jgi:hypothetical protein